MIEMFFDFCISNYLQQAKLTNFPICPFFY